MVLEDSPEMAQFCSSMFQHQGSHLGMIKMIPIQKSAASKKWRDQPAVGFDQVSHALARQNNSVEDAEAIFPIFSHNSWGSLDPFLPIEEWKEFV